jgi:hypothetical protein
MLTGLAAVIGSAVTLGTLLVQAGVLGASPAGQTTTAAPTRPAPTRNTASHAPSLDRAFGRLNELLAESARTKGDLGALIADVNAEPPIAFGAARREIDAIVRQRESLRQVLAGFQVPDELSNALALLRDSITASLADDRLVRQWIVARYDGDAAAGRLWQAQLEASREATRAKGAFTSAYGELLRAHGLPGVVPEY